MDAQAAALRREPPRASSRGMAAAGKQRSSNSSPTRGGRHAEVQQLFSELDEDGSGALDINEIWKLVRSLRAPSSQRRPPCRPRCADAVIRTAHRVLCAGMRQHRQ